jgi:hypothetical protein
MMCALSMLGCCLVLSACSSFSDAGEEVGRDASATMAYVADDRYPSCIRADEREKIEQLLADSDDPPELPRACGDSPADRAAIALSDCLDGFDGRKRAEAEKFAAECVEKYPPVES